MPADPARIAIARGPLTQFGVTLADLHDSEPSTAVVSTLAAQGISTHWLRHTSVTWVERHYSYGIARAYAGHTNSTGPATTTYIKADLQAVAAALSAMTGQPHPLTHP